MECTNCKANIEESVLTANLRVCPECGTHFRMEPRERLAYIADAGSFSELYRGLSSANPIEMEGYEEKISEAQAKTQMSDAVITGYCTIEKRPALIALMSFEFMGGSMGSVVGEKITRIMLLGAAESLPVIIYATSGGARMQEGLFSLMQMAKTSSAAAELDKAGIPLFIMLCNPVTGGVTASFAMLGDVICAEPGALIGFAGPRVIEGTIREKLPEGFQRAEFQLAKGFVDCIVPRKDQRFFFANMIDAHMHSAASYPFKREITLKVKRNKDGHCENNLKNPLEIKESQKAKQAEVKNPQDILRSLEELARQVGVDIRGELEKIAEKLEAGEKAAPEVWEHVEVARNSGRPRALDYIEMILDDFTELHGDRFFGDDTAMVGGIGFICGMAVTVIGNQKGRNLKETINRNGGMSNPEGYRKALRLARQAEKFKRPVITFIDTQGAYPGIEAEERGIGEAIAVNLREFSRLKTPVICIVIGEGGSGGALGIGVGDKIYMLENAIYSVISPEGFASILLRDFSRAKDAAAMMKITSREVLDLKVINGVIHEPKGGAHANPAAAAAAVRERIIADLNDLCRRNPEVLVKYRNKKIRETGAFYDDDGEIESSAHSKD